MHEHTRKIAVREEILENVQHLRVKQGRRGILTGSRCAGQDKNPGTDDRPNPQRRKRPGAERLLQPALRPLGIGNQFVDGLLGK